MDLLHVGHRFLGRAHIGLRDDFQQGRAGTVEVNTGHTVKIFMQGLAGIFFQVGAGHANGFAAAVFQLDGDFTHADNRQFILTDLIALGEIGIEIILARKHRHRRNLGVDRQAELDRHCHHLRIQYRQHTRQAQVDGTGLGVGYGPIGGGGTGKDFAVGGQLGMNFQADDCFPFHILNS